jgi:hypothetical protein
MRQMVELSVQDVEENHKKGHAMLTCEDALNLQKYPVTNPDKKLSYEEGFKNGWYDRYLGHSLMVARTSPDTYYATGYSDGQIAYDCYSSPLKEEGGMICLRSLLA